VLAFLAMLSVMIAAATSSQMMFISRLQSLGGINYQTQILGPAEKLGLTPGAFSVYASVMAGMTFINLNLIGNTWVADVAGEVKNPTRTHPLAIFGGMALLMLTWGLEYSLIWITPGGDFWHANSLLYWTGQSPFPVPPVVNMVILYLTSNPILIYVASIGYFACSFGTALSTGYTPARITFAWALDRVIPDAFGKVDKRGTPRATWLFGLVIGFFILVLYAFTDWLAYVLYSISEWFLAWIVIGVAAIAFPYVKKTKDIFEKSPSVVKAKLGGVPMITIWGILMIIVSAYSVYASIVPGLTGTTSLYKLVGSIVFIAVLPVIIYLVAHFYRRSKGFSLELQYKTIPPD
jgi:amino acid transporter